MSTPVRLQKKPDNTNSFKFNERIEAWCIKHATICLLTIFVLFAVLFVILCYALVGVSATESGTVYNHLWGVI